MLYNFNSSVDCCNVPKWLLLVCAYRTLWRFAHVLSARIKGLIVFCILLQNNRNLSTACLWMWPLSVPFTSWYVCVALYTMFCLYNNYIDLQTRLVFDFISNIKQNYKTVLFIVFRVCIFSAAEVLYRYSEKLIMLVCGF